MEANLYASRRRGYKCQTYSHYHIVFLSIMLLIPLSILPLVHFYFRLHWRWFNLTGSNPFFIPSVYKRIWFWYRFMQLSGKLIASSKVTRICNMWMKKNINGSKPVLIEGSVHCLDLEVVVWSYIYFREKNTQFLGLGYYWPLTPRYPTSIVKHECDHK